MESSGRVRGNASGPTSDVVGENVARIRQLRHLKQADLAELVAELGRKIPTASIGKIELGLRRVEVDDLMVLALALGVSPLSLLLPDTRRPEENVQISGANGRADVVWRWALGEIDLMKTGRDEIALTDSGIFRHEALPGWIDVETRVYGPSESR
ncbi:XRE family transcriptional regulator [Rathayibacter sp. AY1A2]|uniref:helix-turn-helix domain-containing protein n=1 Tax=Rathayibacter sp. AY1A2 TaxID=2080520 RepID=UPI000CE7CAD2|nr:helix-turn-helix transcriptional regulator [Rathayibacter sp. AY1A2]PPF41331.1 XRE family transcriptional regulator [Rathayibacter sp. AY1A2]